MPNKILLLDSNSLVHRAYHALPNLKTSKGFCTGAIFGFMSILLRLIKEQKPTHIAAAFDLKGPTFRNEMFEDYKAKRKPMDEELRLQIEPLKQLLDAMNIKIVSKQGYEGDDILGTLANRFKDDTIIVTGDRDSFQLVDDTTRIFWTKKGVSEIEVYDEKRLLEDGFTVSQFIDFKALRGDPSDNIPGVAGVGEKTAKQWLETYGSLDQVFEHANEITGKVGETLRNSHDIALLSRKLATIDKNVPLDCSLQDLEFKPNYSAKVKQMMAEFEMTSLFSRMVFDADNAEEVEKVEEIKHEAVKLTTATEIEKAIVGDRIALIIDENIRFAVDCEREYIINCVVDLFSEGVNFDEALEIVSKQIKGKTLVCYDYKSLSKAYKIKAENFFDVMIACHLARESAPIKSIDVVFGKDGKSVNACEMLTVANSLQNTLKQKNLDKLFYELEQPLAVVLLAMEQRGFSVSSKKLQQLQEKYDKILTSLTEKIYEEAGEKFNIASPKQLGEVLFDHLGLAHGKKTKTGYSVGEETLTNLVGEHQVIKYILEWRHFQKLQSTYVLGLQPLVNRGKIHTEFNQCITTTGRLSSTNPNLQNIPVRGDEAQDIKSAFTASDGGVLVSADYSQIELRLLAHMSGDQKLIDAYKRADDIHAMTAATIFGVDIKDVTPSQRREAKAVNFGIIYGISGFGLAENLSIPQYKAKAFIDKYFETYPTVKAYIESNVALAKERGYAETMLGRKRNLSDITASNYLVRSSAERMAMNTPLQGSAADIIKIAMLKVEKRLENMQSKMILQVHDELIIDATRDEADAVKKILVDEMESAVQLKVPLVAEPSVSDNWGNL
ncbi:MAG: DNA polymerase I [Clostridia bacterium]